MSRNKKRKGKKTNILLGFICIILVGVLGTILVMSYNTEQEEAKRLTELAGNQQSGIEDIQSFWNIQRTSALSTTVQK